MEVPMAKRKRGTRRSGIVGRAVSAGRRALREAEKRVPPDLRRQVERRIKEADKSARAAIKQLQVQAKKASTRADVNSVLKRIDGLTKQARQVARGASSRAASTRRRATRRIQGTVHDHSAQENGSWAELLPPDLGVLVEGITLIDLCVSEHSRLERALEVFLKAGVRAA